MSVCYNPSTIPANYYVFGAGGTGARIVQMLAQLISSIDWVARAEPVIYVFDDDVVEEKNLKRQLFSKADVGKPKAEVVSRRYSAAYGVNIIPILRRVMTEADVIVPVRETYYAQLAPKPKIECLMPAVIGMTRPSISFLAVDSMEARRCIIAALAHMYFPFNNLIIDPGNEDDFGQISVFNCFNEQLYTPKLGYASNYMGWVNNIPDQHLHQFNLHLIPMPMTKYLMAEDTVGSGSCGDMEQTLAINAIVAAACVGIAQDLMMCKPIITKTAYFGTGASNNRSEVFTLPWLRSISQAENRDYVHWQTLYDWLDVDPSVYTLERFRDDFMLSPCAHESMAHAYRRQLTPGQIQLLRNQIFFPCVNLEDFTPNRLEELNQAAIQRAMQHAAELEASAAQQEELGQAVTEALHAQAEEHSVAPAEV